MKPKRHKGGSSERPLIVDANVILRYLLRDHEKFFREAKNVFDTVFSGERRIFLLDAVLAEVVYVLEGFYGVKRKEISEALLSLLKAKGMQAYHKEALIKALKIFSESNLDFVDGLLCAYGEEFPILSFDKKVRKCAGD